MSKEKDAVVKRSSIQINIGFNEDKIPVEMDWAASENDKAEACKAFMLSLFDAKTKDTLKIDLWTKSMQVMEMDRFIFQSLKAINDTYYRSTQNKELAQEMNKFVQYFGEKTGIIPSQNNQS